MKSYITSLKIITAVLFVFFSFAGCNEEFSGYLAGGNIEITESLPTNGDYDVNVTGLQTSSGNRQINVSWIIPQDQTDLAYFLVEWEGLGSADATVYSQSVKKTENSLILDHLYNESYKITVKCVSLGFLSSGGVSITESPVFDTKAPDIVTNVVIEPLAIAASLTWINPVDDDLYKFVITVTDVNDPSFLKTVELPAYAISYHLVDLQELSQYNVTIDSYDYIGNYSSTSVQFKTMAEILLNNDIWTIEDFSAEETSGEGSTGRAKDTIDNDDATYWHSPWTGGGSSLPQWIIINLGQEVIPTTLISYKRNNNNNGPMSVKIEGSLDYKEWNDFGTFSLSATNNNGQNCNLQNSKKSRYIKYTVLTSPNNYAMVREIKIRALVSE